jgi:capsule polysaccharide export protein KpsE/RkpR
MKLIDRVAAGIDQLGKRAAQALDESKLRMEQAGVRRRKDHAARELGYLAYRKSKGETVADSEAEVLIRRMAAADDEIAKLEDQIAKVRATAGPDAAGPAAPSEAPASEAKPEQPAPAEPGAPTA